MFFLSRFVLEAKKKSGEPYNLPRSTLIAIGLHMATNDTEMKLLNGKEFVALKNTFA